MFSDDDKTTLTKARVLKYIQLSKEARKKASPIATSEVEKKKLDKITRMFDDYLSDSQHFLEHGDLVRAFGAVNYAHAWIDCAVRIGLMDGHGDEDLFTLP